MSYYIGFLKKQSRHIVVFKSVVAPKKSDLTFFVQVMGPFETEGEAKSQVVILKRRYGYTENPIKGLVTKGGIRKAIALTKKVIKIYGILRKKNPGVQYHDQKFLYYMKELEKYVVGSVPYIKILATAYAHLQSARDSR